MSSIFRWLWGYLNPPASVSDEISDSAESQTVNAEVLRPNLPVGQDSNRSVPSAVRPPSTAESRPKSVTGYDAYLVFDVEATCEMGNGFDWYNEIIELPVCLVQPARDGDRKTLEVVAEFMTYVKPTYNKTLSEFCTNLTGITQAQVDAAPEFPAVLDQLAAFMRAHQLIDDDLQPLKRFVWCSDTPFDMQDFMLKQCHISQIPLPGYMRGDILDVRASVRMYLTSRKTKHKSRVMAGNIDVQLAALGLPPFQGRHHSGIDDTRNIVRILIELSRVGFKKGLSPNTRLRLDKRWPWMDYIPVDISQLPPSRV